MPSGHSLKFPGAEKHNAVQLQGTYSRVDHKAERQTCFGPDRVHSAVPDSEAAAKGNELPLQAGEARAAALDLQKPGSLLHPPGSFLRGTESGSGD